MSLSLLDRTVIALTPERLSVLRVSLLTGEAVGDRVDYACAALVNGAGWHPVVEALQSVVGDTMWRGGHASVVLSNRFFRFLLLPFDENAREAEVLERLARHHLTLVYGDCATRWALKCCRTAPRGPILISAVDDEFLATLRSTLEGVRVRIASVQPYLMSAFNHFHRRFRTESTWFVVHEPERLTVSLFIGGEWRAVAVRSTNDSWPDGLAALLDWETQTLGLDEACTDVALVGTDRCNVGHTSSRYRFDQLDPRSVRSSRTLGEMLAIDEGFTCAQ